MLCSKKKKDFLTLNESDSNILRIDRLIWLVHINQITEEGFSAIWWGWVIDTCKCRNMRETYRTEGNLIICWDHPHACGPLDRGSQVRWDAGDLWRTFPHRKKWSIVLMHKKVRGDVESRNCMIINR